MKKIFTLCGLVFMFFTGTTNAYGQENASNPLSSVNSIDLRFEYFDIGKSELYELWIDGSYMLTPKLKLKYEVHYWDTDVTGVSHSNFESLHFKPIYFPKQGKLGEWKYKLAVGGEWIIDFGNQDKGIGSGSDQIAPLAGVALVRGNTVIVPLVQHFFQYNGPNVNTTAFRMIAIQSLPNNFWGKLDAIVPINWANNRTVPATAEVQVGKMFNPSFGVFVDALAGIGDQRPFDWGAGLGVRFNY